jgi:hypothetical protein
MSAETIGSAQFSLTPAALEKRWKALWRRYESPRRTGAARTATTTATAARTPLVLASALASGHFESRS